jgi:predicted acylesterase/phospholipase RssA
MTEPTVEATVVASPGAPLPMCRLLAKKFLVFSGGGPKGKAYNGALLAYDLILKLNGVADGIHTFKGFAGTSAGALWAMLMSMVVTVEELFEMTMSQDMSFVYQHIQLMHFPKQFGIVSNRVIMKPIEDMIKLKGFSSSITFKQLFALTRKELKVCVTNVNMGVHEIWDHRTTPDMRVVEAVATSMSIPGFFSPTQILIRAPDAVEPCPAWKGIQVIEKPTVANASVAEIGPRYYGDGGLTVNIPHHVFDSSDSMIFAFEESPCYTINSSKDYLYKLLFVPLAQADKTCLAAVPVANRCNIVMLHTGQISVMDLNMEVSKSCALVQYAMYQMLTFWTTCQEYQLSGETDMERSRKWHSMYFALTVQLQLMISKLTNPAGENASASASSTRTLQSMASRTGNSAAAAAATTTAAAAAAFKFGAPTPHKVTTPTSAFNFPDQSAPVETYPPPRSDDLPLQSVPTEQTENLPSDHGEVPPGNGSDDSVVPTEPAGEGSS